MPDWTSNVVKIYVPAELEPLIDQVVSALAHPEAGANEPAETAAIRARDRWIDFERLCPTGGRDAEGESGIGRQETIWGTKWNVDAIDPPRIYPAADHDALYEYYGCIVVDYAFDTAWTEPTGYMAALAGWCSGMGLGLQWWHDIDEPAFNPRTNETETQWVEADDVRKAAVVLPMVEQCALLTGGVPTGAMAFEPTEPRNPEGRTA